MSEAALVSAVASGQATSQELSCPKGSYALLALANLHRRLTKPIEFVSKGAAVAIASGFLQCNGSLEQAICLLGLISIEHLPGLFSNLVSCHARRKAFRFATRLD